ncbi:hypothetical protein [Coraliomargarita akajimensis]|uniref:Peptidase S41 n=1 Tax=Coraliomargarita akajimensis (strain DSM 45221 / IAM 15411 / JCM 23193 / KCTC 12865 / 04OKA010-24) TaxID=583355 RepID=D5EMK6_CORAD|nr:hypothetical protein [Coraliomargarita akajimensis]ADE53412.1 hypothetical protein Caka_0387 [Coraliomargarita akajimensis DSM 45221]
MRFRQISLTAAALISKLMLAADLPEELFPGIHRYSDQDLRLQGIAALYPNRVCFDSPRIQPADRHRRAASIETIEPAITYLRIYRFDEAIESLRQQLQTESLIIDLRFTQSPELELEFFDLLAEHSLTQHLEVIGTTEDFDLSTVESTEHRDARQTPPLVLINRHTTGPFEACIDYLQASGQIVCVGDSTGGQTGSYTQHRNYWLLAAEVRQRASNSLIGVGVRPRIQVQTEPEEDYISYHLYETGSDLQRLIGVRLSSENDNDEDPQAAALDQILVKAVDILAALQILQDYQP